MVRTWEFLVLFSLLHATVGEIILENIKHPCLHVAFKGKTQNFVLRNKPGYFVQILRLFLREAITARGWFPKLKWPVIHTRSNPSSGPYIFSTRGLLS